MSLPRGGVTIVEVGPRDGLQNEKRLVPAADKAAFIDMLSACGFRRIEAASFVSARRVPQLADGAAVLAAIRRNASVTYSALVPNLEGYKRAKLAGAGEVAVFASASEGFSQANINCPVSESLERFRPVIAAAQADGIAVRGYVSCVADCPYDGPVPPQAVADAALALLNMGCYEIALGETLGRATPAAIAAMLDAVLNVAPADRLAGHYHDTGGNALANVEVSLAKGLRVFDGSAGGLGGCPFAPGAKGNVATEVLARYFQAQGLHTGIDLEKLERAAEAAQSFRAV